MALAVAAVAAVILTRPDRALPQGGPAPPTRTPGPLDERQAYDAALAEAREWGLVGSPKSHITRELTLGRFATLAGERFRARAGAGPLRPGDRVWAVSFLGEVRRQLATTGETLEYDNITVLLDAGTGRTVWIEAYFDDYESPFRVPRWYDGTQPAPTLPPERGAR